MKGILYTPENIKAIVELRKTQTRRIEAALRLINESPNDWRLDNTLDLDGKRIFNFVNRDGELRRVCPRYQVGETVYIKEAWAIARWLPYEVVDIIFRDGRLKLDIPWDAWCSENQHKDAWENWRSPRFLREKFARYFIVILDVKAQRLQEIMEEDAEADGASWMGAGDGENYDVHSARECFANLWDSINPKYPFESNPWVFAYTFKLLQQ